MNAKYNEIIELREWLSEVKALDDEKRFERLQAIKAFEQSTAASCAVSHANASGSQNILTGRPSRQANSGPTASAPADSTAKPDYPPKLTDEEKALLLKYDGCLKCRKPFVFHKGSDKAPGCVFPVRTGYKPVTFATITATMPANYKAKVASVVPSTGIATSSTHLVAAIFSGIANPVDYLASNQSSVMPSDGDADDSVSPFPLTHAVMSVVDSVDAPLIAKTVNGLSAPLSVPHLFWRAAAASNSGLVLFDCLIDNGSHLVLIRDSLVNELALPRRKLHKPFETELAMREGEKKVVVHLYEYVKLRLCDASGEYSAKSVHAIIAPNLVSPVICGLPFLSHNSIVVDHAARTIIDKVQNFDLMNPTIRSPPPAPKKKLKEIFKDLQADQKIMVAELKMVCAERQTVSRYKCDYIKPLDVVASVLSRVKLTFTPTCTFPIKVQW
jgi:hypothetical protein